MGLSIPAGAGSLLGAQLGPGTPGLASSFVGERAAPGVARSRPLTPLSFRSGSQFSKPQAARIAPNPHIPAASIAPRVRALAIAKGFHQ